MFRWGRTCSVAVDRGVSFTPGHCRIKCCNKKNWVFISRGKVGGNGEFQMHAFETITFHIHLYMILTLNSHSGIDFLPCYFAAMSASFAESTVIQPRATALANHFFDLINIRMRQNDFFSLC